MSESEVVDADLSAWQMSDFTRYILGRPSQHEVVDDGSPYAAYRLAEQDYVAQVVEPHIPAWNAFMTALGSRLPIRYKVDKYGTHDECATIDLAWAFDYVELAGDNAAELKIIAGLWAPAASDSELAKAAAALAEKRRRVAPMLGVSASRGLNVWRRSVPRYVLAREAVARAIERSSLAQVEIFTRTVGNKEYTLLDSSYDLIQSFIKPRLSDLSNGGYEKFLKAHRLSADTADRQGVEGILSYLTENNRKFYERKSPLLQGITMLIESSSISEGPLDSSIETFILR